MQAARCLNKIGELELRLEREEKAKKCFETSISILTDLQLDCSADMVAPLYNYGVMLYTRHSYDAAKVSYLRAIAIHTQLWGECTVGLANIYDCMGLLLNAQVEIILEYFHRNIYEFDDIIFCVLRQM